MKSIKTIMNEYNEKMIGIQNEMVREIKHSQGVFIDYKTFSQIVNSLAVASSHGVIESDLYNKLIEMNLEQTKEYGDIEQNKHNSILDLFFEVLKEQEVSKTTTNCEDCESYLECKTFDSILRNLFGDEHQDLMAEYSQLRNACKEG